MSDKSSVLQELVQRARSPEDQAPELDGEDRHDSQAFAAARSRRDRVPMLELRFQSNQPHEALDYSYLTRMRWNGETGTIQLLYTPLAILVIIEGMGLFDLKEKLRQHHVTWIQEQGCDERLTRAAQLAAQERNQPFVWVRKITIRERDDS